MSKRRKRGPALSLFPFLNILLCTIGVLAFVVISLGIISMFTRPEVWNVAMEVEVVGEDHSMRPLYVECHGDMAVVHPQGSEVRLDRLEAGDSPFMQLVDQVSQAGDEYIVFAVYPDGIGCFREARAIARKRGIDIGSEPMDGGWRLKQ